MEDNKMRDKINHYKNELRQLTFMNNQVRKINDELEAISVNLREVKAIDPSKEPGTGVNAGFNLTYWLEKEQLLIKERAIYQHRVDKVNDLLDSIEYQDRVILTDVYIKNRTMENVALRSYMSIKKLRMKIDKIITRFIENGPSCP